MSYSIPLLCSGEEDLSANVRNVSDHSRSVIDAASEMQKKAHESSREISVAEAAKLREAETCHHVSSGGCQEEKSNVKEESFISKSRNMGLDQQICAEGAVSIAKLKSNVSLESGQGPTKGNFGLGGQESNKCLLSSAENGLKFVMHQALQDMQCKTESCSSNSMHSLLPASSNDSCQEMSADIKFCRHRRANSMDASAGTDINSYSKDHSLRRFQGLPAPNHPHDTLNATVSSPGKLCDVVEADKIAGNDRVRDNDKVPGSESNCHSMAVENSNPQANCSKIPSSENPAEKSSIDPSNTLAVTGTVAREVEQGVFKHREASVSSCYMKEKTGLQLNSVDSADSNGCLTDTGSKFFPSEKHKCHGLSRAEELVNLELPNKSEWLSGGVGCNMLQGSTGGLYYQGVLSKRENADAGDRATDPLKIDLNEDLLTTDVEHSQELVKQSTTHNGRTVSKPIPMMAKSGVPISFPTYQMQSEIESDGWRGSATTSAFRPTHLSGNRNGKLTCKGNDDCSGHSQARGIDLNISTMEPDSGLELDLEKSVLEVTNSCSTESSVKGSPGKARRLNIDLNCGSENDDAFQEVFPLASKLKLPVRDFDLNLDPRPTDACGDAQPPSQSAQALRSSGSDDPVHCFVGFERRPFLNGASQAYQTEFGSVQAYSQRPSMFTAQSMLPPHEQLHRVASLQPKLKHPIAPPQGVFYDNIFCIDPNNGLSSNMYSSNILPFITAQGAAIIPHVLGSGTINQFPPAPHLPGFSRGPVPADAATMRPFVDLNNLATGAEYGSGAANVGHLFFPVSYSRMEEHKRSFHQVPLSAPPMKRKEPDGGWDTH